MKHSIGLDIGGTKIHGILFREDGKILKQDTKPSIADKSSDEIISNISLVVDSLLSGFDKKKLSGIGIGCAGVTDMDGKFLFNPNLPALKGKNLKAILSKKYRIKTAQENDANCFAIAEYFFGAGKSEKNMIGLIIGTGIGGGIILSGNLYKGSNGFSGEFGHSVINPDGPKCNCGLRGDFESLCSGPSIMKRYYSLGGKIKDANPSKIFSSKEPIAKKTVSETIKFFGIGISHIVNALDIELIVLGGGVSNIDFYSEINKSVKKYSNEAVRKNVRVVKNKLGDSSGAIGAAIIGMK